MDITFIIGCARSGTSILHDVISAHPKIMPIFEEPVWGKVLQDGDTHMVQTEDYSDAKRGKIRKWFKMYKREGKIVMEKNPRHIVRIPFIKEIFPEAKLIHIVRDGRDTACSLKSGLCGKTWAHVKPPKWREIEANYQGVIRCAHAWKDIMDIAVQDLGNHDHLQVKYEDLIDDAAGVATDILEYMGLEMTESVKDFCTRVQDEVSGSYAARNQGRWHVADHEIRVGRWKTSTTVEEQVEMEKILRPTLNYFGYP